MNTHNVETGEDELANRDALASWLRAAGLLGEADELSGPEDLRRVLDLREALRAALAANHDGAPPPADARAVINREAARAPLALRYEPPFDASLVPAGDGLDRAIGTLFAIVYDALRDGSWRRLKVCCSDACRWAFYDESRNRSGKWCDMAVCGNREKARAFRERHGC